MPLLSPLGIQNPCGGGLSSRRRNIVVLNARKSAIMDVRPVEQPFRRLRTVLSDLVARGPVQGCKPVDPSSTALLRRRFLAGTPPSLSRPPSSRMSVSDQERSRRFFVSYCGFGAAPAPRVRRDGVLMLSTTPPGSRSRSARTEPIARPDWMDFGLGHRPRHKFTQPRDVQREVPRPRRLHHRGVRGNRRDQLGTTPACRRVINSLNHRPHHVGLSGAPATTLTRCSPQTDAPRRARPPRPAARRSSSSAHRRRPPRQSFAA